MLESAVAAARLAGELDAVLSVDAIRMYKPRPEVYAAGHRCVRRRAPTRSSFVSSNRWDVMGAAAFGFRAVWVNRAGAPDEYPELPPALVVPGLSGVTALVA